MRRAWIARIASRAAPRNGPKTVTPRQACNGSTAPAPPTAPRARAAAAATAGSSVREEPDEGRLRRGVADGSERRGDRLRRRPVRVLVQEFDQSGGAGPVTPGAEGIDRATADGAGRLRDQPARESEGAVASSMLEDLPQRPEPRRLVDPVIRRHRRGDFDARRPQIRCAGEADLGIGIAEYGLARLLRDGGAARLFLQDQEISQPYAGFRIARGVAGESLLDGPRTGERAGHLDHRAHGPDQVGIRHVPGSLELQHSVLEAQTPGDLFLHQTPRLGIERRQNVGPLAEDADLLVELTTARDDVLAVHPPDKRILRAERETRRHKPMEVDFENDRGPR